MAFNDLDDRSHRAPCFSICSELDGSDELALALGEGWEPFAVLPTTARNDWGEEYETVLVYLKIKR